MRKLGMALLLLFLPTLASAAVTGTAWGRTTAPFCGGTPHVCVLSLTTGAGDQTTVYCAPPIDTLCQAIPEGAFVIVDIIGYPQLCPTSGEDFPRLYANATPRWYR